MCSLGKKISYCRNKSNMADGHQLYVYISDVNHPVSIQFGL